MTASCGSAFPWRYLVTFGVGVGQGVALTAHYQTTAMTVIACVWMVYLGLKA